MWKSFVIFLTIMLPGLLPAIIEGNTNKPIDPILVTINDEKISKLDFEYLILRLVNGFDFSQKAINTDYSHVLSAYIKYKLLVHEAKLGINEDSVLASEFEDYFSSKKKSDYFLDLVEQEVLREAFIRSHYMIDASHILLSFPENIDRSEKSLALNKALDLKNQIDNKKVEFEQLVHTYSDDSYSQHKSGKLAVFTVFEQLYPIESAAYQTTIGAISNPVESRFGYHLIKTNRKTRINGQKDVSHILIKSPHHEDQNSKEKILKIYSELNNNFAEIAKQYSEDYESAGKGGSLGTDRLLDQLEWKKIELPVGHFSKPLRTKLGWHILKVNELIPFMSYWQQESKLKNMIQLDSRISRVMKNKQAINENTPRQRVKQSYRNFFLTIKLLQKNSAGFDEKNSTELDLIKNILDKKLDIDFSTLNQKKSAEIDPNVLETLFN